MKKLTFEKSLLGNNLIRIVRIENHLEKRDFVLE